MTQQSIPTDARIGHVHLKVADLDRAVNFYRDIMGFDLVTKIGDQAWDRDPSVWRKPDGSIQMGRSELDIQGLLAEAGDAATWNGGTLPADTRIGHIHLKVSDVERSMHFYRDLMGFDVVSQMGTQ